MRSATIFVPLMAVLLSACSNPPQAPKKTPLANKVGQNCTVQFKRGDGLGAGGDSPVAPEIGSINGSKVYVSGKLHAVSADWIAVESADREYFIPLGAILLVQFDK